MFQLLHALAGRVRALFFTDAALEMEAEFLSRQAERRADLLRAADRYEQEGLHGIAQQLRQQVEDVGSQRPLATVLPAVDHLLGRQNESLPLLPHVAQSTAPALESRLPRKPARNKKGR